jgi:sulfur-oxidizing protein SoxX
MKTTRFSSFAGSFLVGLFLVGALLVAGIAQAADIGPMDVKFLDDNNKIDTSLSGKAGDAVAGRKTFANRKLGNCLACHVNSEMGEQSFHGEIGPSLDKVSERYSAAELRAILVDSKKSLSETTMMPGFYSLGVGVRVADKFKDKTILNAQQVEDILAYLQTLK